jgi:hypothetical protein
MQRKLLAQFLSAPRTKKRKMVMAKTSAALSLMAGGMAIIGVSGSDVSLMIRMRQLSVWPGCWGEFVILVILIASTLYVVLADRRSTTPAVGSEYWRRYIVIGGMATLNIVANSVIGHLLIRCQYGK